jgi:hypothetical protein
MKKAHAALVASSSVLQPPPSSRRRCDYTNVQALPNTVVVPVEHGI